MSKYMELTSANFSEAESGVSLVVFSAPWCGPCKMLTPVIEELVDDFKDKAKICKVNTDEEADLSAKFGIRSVPTLIFFKDGQAVDTIIGAQSKQAISDKLNSLL